MKQCFLIYCLSNTISAFISLRERESSSVSYLRLTFCPKLQLIMRPQSGADFLKNFLFALWALRLNFFVIPFFIEMYTQCGKKSAPSRSPKKAFSIRSFLGESGESVCVEQGTIHKRDNAKCDFENLINDLKFGRMSPSSKWKWKWNKNRARKSRGKGKV